MLSPDTRSLYTSALTPPPGMKFIEAIATSFSLDPTIALSAPVYLALLASDEQSEPDPLAMLEAVRQCSERISLYVDAGRIQVPPQDKILFSFLEDMVIEAESPGGGAFHPKLWAIRFESPGGEKTIMRLVVLTRNMTTDKSWDLALRLEGSVEGRVKAINRPLAEFFKQLPDLAMHGVTKQRQVQATRLASLLRRTNWELPEGFEHLAFHFSSGSLHNWKWLPQSIDRAAIISPFCSDLALRTLADEPIENTVLISRPETLSSLSPETISCFQEHLYCLDEAAEREDGDDIEAAHQPLAVGLHAKAYIFERRYYTDWTHVVMGSANATNAALTTSRNVEVLVELIGRRKNVGGIDDLLGQEGLGPYLQPAEISEQEIDSERNAAEADLDSARRSIIHAGLSIECHPSGDEGQWTLTLVGVVPELKGIAKAASWPITVKNNYAVDIRFGQGDRLDLGPFSAASVTALIAFELKTFHPGVGSRFVLNLPIEGIPEDRRAAIMQSVIKNREGFIRYLMLLLSAESDTNDVEIGLGTGFRRWLMHLADGQDVPLLEELTRTFSRSPKTLREISRLVRDLTDSESGRSVIPEDFITLWEVFEAALEDDHD